MKLFYPNLAFEEELASPHHQASAATQRVVTELGPLMVHLMQPEDRLLTPNQMTWPTHLQRLNHATVSSAEVRHHRPRSDSHTDVEFVPWGWSQQAVREARDAGVPHSRTAADVSVVERINSRAFNADVDVVFGAEATEWPFRNNGHNVFGMLCRTIGEWRSARRQLQHAGCDCTVTKPMLSHAARNRLLVDSNRLNSQQDNWLQRRLETQGAVYVEPWVPVVDQAGLQFEIGDEAEESNSVQLVGVTELRTDSAGRYWGSLMRPDGECADRWKRAVEFGTSVGRRARELGYRGPIGIDCFQFRTAQGSTMTRLCNDINGRLTMGRLALAVRKLCRPAETALWLQAPARRIHAILPGLADSSGQIVQGDVRAISTSPRTVNERPVAASSLLVAAKNPAAAVELAESIQNAAVG